MRLGILSSGLATALLLSASLASALPAPDDEDMLACYGGAVGLHREAECPELGRFEAEGETYYVTAFGAYRESNGCAGVQTLASDCDGDGEPDETDDWQNLYDVYHSRAPVVGEAIAPAASALDMLACAFLYFFDPQGDGAHCGTLSETEAAGGVYYTSLGPASVYEESNGCPGLQTEPSDCDGDGAEDPRDQRLMIADHLPASTAAPPAIPLAEALACLDGNYGPDGDGTAECPEIARVEVDGATYYVAPDAVYREENGCAGLQTQPVDCDGDGEAEATDDHYSVRDVATEAAPGIAPAFEAVVPMVEAGFEAFEAGMLLTRGASDVTFCILAYQIGTDDADEECEAAIQTYETPAGVYYFVPRGLRAYAETNGCAGLQRDAGDCDGDGDAESADAYVPLPYVNEPGPYDVFPF